VIAVEQRNDRVALMIETPDGSYRLHAQYVVACDGARSSLRQMVGAEFAGQVFEDQFLIADVKMTAAFPTERWFWFDPPFHAGRSALLHKQPDDTSGASISQLNRYADPVVEKKPENVRPRIARMLGHDKFEFEWISLYKFQCRRMDQLHPWPGDLCRRFGASGLAVWRARRQFGTRGCRKPGVEARSRAARLSPEACSESYHMSSAARPPTRTSANPPARPISWRRN
jgi:2-polyprenyl-6-methoxyphenol hydroxylase-like FAD-dependent oxidoreductase